MTKRDIMKALIQGEDIDFTPQWLMAFFNDSLMRELMPKNLQYDNYGIYPEEGSYPFCPAGNKRLLSEQNFNSYIDRCAFPVGWGANAAFGHSGPGEFNKTIIKKESDRFFAQYETGSKWEIRLNPHNVHIYDLPVKTEEDLQKIALPSPVNPDRYSGFKEDVTWAKEHGEWTVGWVNGFFSGVHYFFRDYAEFFVDLMLNPDFAKKLIEKCGNWTLEAARMMCESGIDCIGFCDDLGSGQSLLMSPEMYREFFWPWHRKLCDLAHNYGTVVHMHSHGAISPILPDIASAGIDILNPLDPDDKMPMAEVREAVGHKIVLCGGMNKHFFDWNRDQKSEHLKEIVKNGKKYGPHILMDSGGIPENVNCEEFEWFLAASREIRSKSK